MTKSILQPNDKKCFITGAEFNLDKHHIYGGIKNRNLADKYGCWVWLRHDVHMRLHDSDKALDKHLKILCQKKFEETHSRDEFRKIFGKSYI